MPAEVCAVGRCHDDESRMVIDLEWRRCFSCSRRDAELLRDIGRLVAGIPMGYQDKFGVAMS
jgi:hypothetical protein